jgi:hypothetical protein
MLRRKSILVLAAATALALPASPQKETGALEGTVVDQKGTPVRACTLIIERVGYVAQSSRMTTRWELRTDKMGHFFFKRFPVGSYSVTVLHPDGRFQIPNVSVEAGRIHNLDSDLRVPAQISPLPEKTLRRPHTPTTQPDIVRGCIAVRNIFFQRARLLLLNSNVGVSGTISNECGHDAYVSIYLSFFNAAGDKIDFKIVEKLVRATGSEFRGGPDASSAEAVRATDGRVTDVFVQ